MSNRKPSTSYGRKSVIQHKGAVDTRKDPKQRILILCEDSKTSPAYFKAMCDDLKLNATTGITIIGKECSPTPDKVYEAIAEFYKKDRVDNPKKDPFDKIYLVIDRDNPHKHYASTIEKVRTKPKYMNAQIILAHSVRCFEFWVLLHFERTTRVFESSDALVKAIRKHIDDYEKENSTLYSMIQDRTLIATAIKNAALVNDEAGDDIHQPQCHIDKLVLDLFKQAGQELPSTQITT